MYFLKHPLAIPFFAALCLIIDQIGIHFAYLWSLPVWLDTFGTFLAAYMLGPLCGAIVGMSCNLIAAINIPSMLYYAPVSIILAWEVGYYSRRGYVKDLYHAMGLGMLVTVTAIVLSTLIGFLANDIIDVGNFWGNGVSEFWVEFGLPPLAAHIIGQSYIEFLDKQLSIIALYFLIKVARLRCLRLPRDRQHTAQTGSSAAAALLALCAIVPAGILSAPQSEAAELSSYGTYMQTRYNNLNGLPCGTANDITSTRDGVLWIGTYAGLYRYNGQTFRWMREFDQIRSVNCLYTDSDGRLLVGTNDNGVIIIVNEKIYRVINEDAGLPSDSVRSIVQSSDGAYYVSTSNGTCIMRLNAELADITPVPGIGYALKSSSGPDGYVSCISQGKVHLLRYGAVTSTAAVPSANGIATSSSFISGRVFTGTSQGAVIVYGLHDGALQVEQTLYCTGLNKINRLVRNFDGNILVCADNGIGFFTPDLEFHRISTGGYDNSIDEVAIDYQQNLWFTSSRLGLLRMSPAPFVSYYEELGLRPQVVNALHLHGNYLYTGTDNGLTILDLRDNAAVHNDLTRILDKTRIRCIIEDRQGRLWICTYNKGLVLSDGTGIIKSFNSANSPLGDRVRVCTELPSGQIAASGDTGLAFISKDEINGFLSYGSDLSSAQILSMTVHPDGSLLAGTDGDGIAVLRGDRLVKHLNRKNGLTSEVVMKVIADKESAGFFLVTSNGLCYMDHQYHIRALTNFPYFNNYDVIPASTGFLFITTSAGIYVVDRMQLLADDSPLEYELLDSRRGLNSNLTPNAWNCLDQEQNLYLCSQSGVIKMNISTYGTPQRTYRMFLRAVEADGKIIEIDRGKPVMIPRNVRHLQFRPEIINYSPEDPFITLSLEGVDQTPHQELSSTLRPVTYTNLQPGVYTFRMQLLDRTHKSVIEESSFEIRKAYAVYDKPWFSFYMVLVAIAMVAWLTWVTMRTRMQRIVDLQKRQLDLANRNAELGRQTILAIAHAVDAKDKYTSKHSTSVSKYATLIAKHIELDEDELARLHPKKPGADSERHRQHLLIPFLKARSTETPVIRRKGPHGGYYMTKDEVHNLEQAARLHDIGKIGIPDHILNKKGPLDDDEYRIMKEHVNRGAEILANLTLIEHAADGARYHHERFDGRGYPAHLKGHDIPLYGRIIGVADAFDAMTSTRVYRKEMSLDYVLGELRKGRGTQFDPDVVDVFLDLIDKGIIDVRQIQNEVYHQNESAGDSKDKESAV